MSNVGFIGVGYMGYGIAKNILHKGNKLFVIANKNRKPIEKIVSEGATEVKTFEEFKEKQLNVLVKCVTNTPIAKEIATKLSNILDEKTLIIDITTHNKSGSIETEKIYQSKNINYKSYAWWLLRECNTRSHSELGSQAFQRQWYFVLRHGRVGLCQA